MIDRDLDINALMRDLHLIATDWYLQDNMFIFQGNDDVWEEKHIIRGKDFIVYQSYRTLSYWRNPEDIIKVEKEINLTNDFIPTIITNLPLSSFLMGLVILNSYYYTDSDNVILALNCMGKTEIESLLQYAMIISAFSDSISITIEILITDMLTNETEIIQLSKRVDKILLSYSKADILPSIKKHTVNTILKRMFPKYKDTLIKIPKTYFKENVNIEEELAISNRLPLNVKNLIDKVDFGIPE